MLCSAHSIARALVAIAAWLFDHAGCPSRDADIRSASSRQASGVNNFAIMAKLEAPRGSMGIGVYSTTDAFAELGRCLFANTKGKVIVSVGAAAITPTASTSRDCERTATVGECIGFRWRRHSALTWRGLSGAVLAFG